MGEISCTEFLEGYKAFCDYAIAHDTMEHEDGFTESRLFQVAINHLPSIIDILNQYEAEYHGDPGLRKSCVDEYLKMIRQIPRTGNSKFFDMLPRLKPWNSLTSSGSIIQSYRLNYSHCVQDLC